MKLTKNLYKRDEVVAGLVAISFSRRALKNFDANLTWMFGYGIVAIAFELSSMLAINSLRPQDLTGLKMDQPPILLPEQSRGLSSSPTVLIS